MGCGGAAPGHCGHRGVHHGRHGDRHSSSLGSFRDVSVGGRSPARLYSLVRVLVSGHLVARPRQVWYCSLPRQTSARVSVASGQGEERVTGVKARPWPLSDDLRTSFHALSPTVRPRCQDDQWTAVGARFWPACAVRVHGGARTSEFHRSNCTAPHTMMSCVVPELVRWHPETSRARHVPSPLVGAGVWLL